MEFTGRFLQFPPRSFFLLGPRGTGKTWLTRNRFQDAIVIDLLDPETMRSLAARPERLAEILGGRPDARTVVIDEIQKLPELLQVVHALIESRRDIQFVLTGSSARKLRRGGVNLLAGRALNLSLHPFMAAELGDSFDLEAALRVGMVPVVLGSPSPIDTIRAYNALYIREEVQAEGLVRNIGQFSRFLESISFSHGSTLNLANVSRETQVGRKTVEGYLEILEDLLIAFRIPVFTRRASRGLATHPKFYMFDAGMFRANRPVGPLDSTSEIDGAALEGLVAQHLLAWCDYTGGGHSLHYWQTRSKVEVDFVVYGESQFQAIEVKNSATVRPAHLAALKAFGADYPEARRWLLYRGRERLLIDGIMCIPVDEFLRSLKPGEFPA